MRAVVGCALIFASVIFPLISAQRETDEQSWLLQLRFSSDGQYLLAQDSKTMWLLDARQLRVLSQIAAPRSTLGQFTPDSAGVVYLHPVHLRDADELKPHVPEFATLYRWHVGDGRLELLELPRLACRTAEASPDGGTLVCVEDDGTLSLIATGSGRVLYRKERFVDYVRIEDETTGRQNVGELGRATVSFSRDGHFLIVRPSGGIGKAFAWDFKKGTPVRLTGRLRSLNRWYVGFAFADASHLVLTVTPQFPHLRRQRGVAKAWVVSFPGGQVLSVRRVPRGPKHSAADPRFVIIRPFGMENRFGYGPKPAAAVEFETGQVIISRKPALDVYGDHYAAEVAPGKVAIFRRGGEIEQTISLPEIE